MSPVAQVPYGFVKMASGRIVPAQTSFGQPKQKAKKFLIVIQHYDGDVKEAEDLASLIADLERTRNHDADVMLFRRADSREMMPNIRTKLEAKFDRVFLQACRRIDARGYPFGANQMWSDLLMLMSQTAPFASDYYAFINFESDAVPTRPGWIGELISAWRMANSVGIAAIGHYSTDPFIHLNGMAVYAADMYRRVGGNILAGGNPQICYDIRHGQTLLPYSKQTPLVFFKYRQASITPAELFAVQRDEMAPCVYHGVKDGSARAAVRARHITFTEKAPAVVITHSPSDAVLQASDVQDPTSFTALDSAVVATVDALIDKQIEESVATAPPHHAAAVSIPATTGKITVQETPPKRPNVYTYYSAKGRQSNESQAVMEAWKKGWTSRGWNPVVLTLREAAVHPKFDDLQARIEQWPMVGDRREMANRFNRWLALDGAGGGLLTDMDVLPGDFTPKMLAADGGSMVFRQTEESEMHAMFVNREDAAEWLATMLAYDAQPEDKRGAKPHVSDDTIVRRSGWQEKKNCGTTTGFPIIKITAKPNDRLSAAMEAFLAAQ